MAMLLLPALDSLTISNRNAGSNRRGKRLTVGRERGYIYESYLFFDTSAVPRQISLLAAALLLFKLNDFYDDSGAAFAVYPLAKSFSPLTTFANACPIVQDPELKAIFAPFRQDAVIEVDITKIAAAWLENRTINRGLAISSDDTAAIFSCRTAFGSAYSKDRSLIPRLRLLYRAGPCINFLEPDAISCSTVVLAPPRR
ncbi:MAG: DNRLRE domain-containing protein [Sporomusaceae bacterium]|nr:DNRLRE domain-containing protein [Sporomusaceae bacterium]